MINYDGTTIDTASPSMPVEILGMNDTAFAGAEFMVTKLRIKEKKISDFKKLIIVKTIIYLARDKTKIFDKKEYKRNFKHNY